MGGEEGQGGGREVRSEKGGESTITRCIATWWAVGTRLLR